MTSYQRIKKIMKFYYDRGVKSERVNAVYRKIVGKCSTCGMVKQKHKMSCYEKVR